jgi:hypothetical protein
MFISFEKEVQAPTRYARHRNESLGTFQSQFSRSLRVCTNLGVTFPQHIPCLASFGGGERAAADPEAELLEVHYENEASIYTCV